MSAKPESTRRAELLDLPIPPEAMRLLPRPKRGLSRHGRAIAWIAIVAALLIIAMLLAMVMAPLFTDAELAAYG